MHQSQVTSRGCSKGYMVCIFFRAWEYAMACHANGTPLSWPYPTKAIESWIIAARLDMCHPACADWDKK